MFVFNKGKCLIIDMVKSSVRKIEGVLFVEVFHHGKVFRIEELALPGFSVT